MMENLIQTLAWKISLVEKEIDDCETLRTIGKVLLAPYRMVVEFIDDNPSAIHIKQHLAAVEPTVKRTGMLQLSVLLEYPGAPTLPGRLLKEVEFDNEPDCQEWAFQYAAGVMEGWRLARAEVLHVKRSQIIAQETVIAMEQCQKVVEGSTPNLQLSAA